MEKIGCGLCGGNTAVPFLKTGGRRLVKCAGCDLVRTGDFDGAKTAYQEDYFHGKNRYTERWEEFCAMFDALLARARGFKRQGKLLDVGAGVGALMSAAKKRGFEVSGVETSTWASAFAREEKGLEVFTGTLADARLETEVFDVVVINHVLEHVRVPLELLAEARRVLKNDGLLVIGVPNIGSIMAGLQGGKWASLRPEEHIWHFTRGTLARLLILAGFKVICFEAKENYPVSGWRPESLVKRLISWVSALANRSEAMLVFAEKRFSSEYAGPVQ
ncbi:MAG: class I SAM-dependent methyltransferase [Elusimicrobiota bacterium]